MIVPKIDIFCHLRLKEGLLSTWTSYGSWADPEWDPRLADETPPGRCKRLKSARAGEVSNPQGSAEAI